ncbi:beta-class phenol-soluble modulin [Lactiplantibacillus plantarum]|uniref:beta-class phenol-soluble modulin n=1 Tax=Lactiplantibacillus plantarum TaxID=1590 RepID=UPI0021A2D3EA|nr:beta-class phenol-soluble modulin [Lactiplantibacillus plantarum]MCT3214132.1 beta-class phenol-soluble modulin [Lactiplantibacillus plantarum]MCT3271728.1 beta-class phenol-soluble modulin [Lactiplantibacillus plantarum]
MAGLFDAITKVVQTAIQGDWVGMGANIVSIVANAINIPLSLAETILRILGFLH